jgi:hypothetical protein
MNRTPQTDRAGICVYRVLLLAVLVCLVAAQPALAGIDNKKAASGPEKGPGDEPTSLAGSDLKGTVYDGTGLPLIGALVAVMLPNGGRAVTVSDTRGQFVLPDLPPGIYTLMAQSLGFVNAVLPGVVVPRHEPLSLQLRAEPELTSLLSAAAPLDLGWAFRPRVRDVLRQSEPTATPTDVAEIPPSTPLAAPEAGPAPAVSEPDFDAFTELAGEVSLLTLAPFIGASFDSASTTAFSLGGTRTDGSQRWILRAQVADRGFMRASSQVERVINESHALRLGGGYAAQDVDMAGLDESFETMWVGSLAAEDHWQLGETILLSSGMRFEHYNYLDTPGVVSPRIEVAYAPIESFVLRSGVYYDAEAPGLAELSFEVDPMSVRYMDILTTDGIEPERSLRYEFGLEKTTPTTELSARAYYDQISDELMSVYLARPSGRSDYTVFNLGDSVNRGFAVNFRQTIMDHLAGHVSYAYGLRTGPGLPAEITAAHGVTVDSPFGDEATPITSVHELSAGVETVVGSYHTRLLATYRWKQGIPVVREGALDDVYERLDLRVRQPLPFRAFSSEWSALVQVQNVLGQEYDGIFDLNIDDLPVLSRLVSGGLAVRF